MNCHKILVVEDDDDIRTTLIELLASEGYHAVPAHHGKEALELMKDRKEDPCLILTDLMMPEMDGWELMAILNELDVVITIPVVVMTAGLTNRILGTRIIKKPFNLEMVVALVREKCGAPNHGPVTKAEVSL
jgi:CheY-like chemotaxis protein